MKRLKVLELFAGSRSFSKVAEELGHETFSVDIKDFDNIDYVTDILDFDVDKIPFKPDVIWASPPCTTFSIASCFHYWNLDKTPKNEKAKINLSYVKKTIEIINYFSPKYFFIENPMGLLRKMELMKQFDRGLVTYCKYGHKNMKFTDIWTNHLYGLFNTNGWKPKGVCRVGNRKCHHDPAPRGSQSGTLGLKNNYERSIVPAALCREILKSCYE
jgi:site-specific DNA-cytosine methylase